MVIGRRGVGLARGEEQQDENPGSHDRDLHSPKGNAARYVLRHGKLPYREDTHLNRWTCQFGRNRRSNGWRP
jgi:hypothetical protein